MNTSSNRSDDELVSCKICLKEIPKSEAKMNEAVDYVYHFCGLECFEKWQNQDTDKKEEK